MGWGTTGRFWDSVHLLGKPRMVSLVFKGKGLVPCFDCGMSGISACTHRCSTSVQRWVSSGAVTNKLLCTAQQEILVYSSLELAPAFSFSCLCSMGGVVCLRTSSSFSSSSSSDCSAFGEFRMWHEEYYPVLVIIPVSHDNSYMCFFPFFLEGCCLYADRFISWASSGLLLMHSLPGPRQEQLPC